MLHFLTSLPPPLSNELLARRPASKLEDQLPSAFRDSLFNTVNSYPTWQRDETQTGQTTDKKTQRQLTQTPVEGWAKKTDLSFHQGRHPMTSTLKLS